MSKDMKENFDRIISDDEDVDSTFTDDNDLNQLI